MEIKSLHHVAYRCKDAKKTADFYTKVLDLEYLAGQKARQYGDKHPTVETAPPPDNADAARV